MHTEEAVPVAVSPGSGNTVEHRSRRAVLKVLLGGGIAASLASFLYPVFRYLIPPLETNLGVD